MIFRAPDQLVTAIDQGAFRKLMSGFPSGVVIVTTVYGNQAAQGATCTAVCSVSLDPPLLLVTMGNRSRTLAAITRSGAVAVNFLHDDAREAATVFSSAGDDKFGRFQTALTGTLSLPMLPAEARAVAECRVRNQVSAGDHVIIIAEVVTAQVLAPERAPLLYGLNRYAAFPMPERSDCLSLASPNALP